MTTTPPLGLRDRKRQETRAKLERAAVTLVLRDGLENVTVDAISELADVSPRTFFNYFDSKDSAILGPRPMDITEQAVEHHLAAHRPGDSVASVVQLLSKVTGTSLGGSRLRLDRMEVVRRYPQLWSDQLANMTQFTGWLTKGVMTILSSDPAFAHLSTAELASRAEVVLALCGSAVRASVREWAATGSDADEQELEQRAISLVNDVVGSLT